MQMDLQGNKDRKVKVLHRSPSEHRMEGYERLNNKLLSVGMNELSQTCQSSTNRRASFSSIPFTVNKHNFGFHPVTSHQQ